LEIDVLRPGLVPIITWPLLHTFWRETKAISLYILDREADRFGTEIKWVITTTQNNGGTGSDFKLLNITNIQCH